MAVIDVKANRSRDLLAEREDAELVNAVNARARAYVTRFPNTDIAYVTASFMRTARLYGLTSRDIWNAEDYGQF